MNFCLDVQESRQSPGPGAYDLTFKDIIKMMDQKLAIRYQISPFGSGKPRFDHRINQTVDIGNSNLTQDTRLNLHNKHAASEVLNNINKDKENSR